MLPDGEPTAERHLDLTNMNFHSFILGALLTSSKSWLSINGDYIPIELSQFLNFRVPFLE